MILDDSMVRDRDSIYGAEFVARVKDAPDNRGVESPHQGTVVALPKVGGLHHRSTRRAA